MPPAGAVLAGGVCFSVHFLSLSDACHEAADFLCGFFFHACCHMGVDIQRKFRFEPIPLSFEPVEPGRCAPVLYSSAVRDMIDYSLRSCVERGVTVRRCKNCGRWFPQTGRVSAEYCERPVKYGEQRCREIGAFRQWTKKQTDDPIFKAYRKEYKKRFAWIKAGRVTDEQFYAWSEQAREEKKKCDREIISLEEFQQWLRDSKI